MALGGPEFVCVCVCVCVRECVRARVRSHLYAYVRASKDKNLSDHSDSGPDEAQFSRGTHRHRRAQIKETKEEKERFGPDLWGRRTPGVVVEVQPVDYFHMTCVRRGKFLFAFCGFNSQFQFAFCFFDLRLPVSTCVLSLGLAF